jgi:hypothetical protein
MVSKRTAPGGTPVGLEGGSSRAGAARTIAWSVRALILGLVLAGCTIPFGNGGGASSPSNESSQEGRREQNRLFLEEQERRERNMQFDRGGPPSDR